MNRTDYAPRYIPSVRRNRGFSPALILAPLIIIAIITVAVFGTVGYFQENKYTDCEVNLTENSYNASSKTMEKRVYTDNCGVFTVNDDPARLHFNSADTYGSIKEGETYTFTATGFRVPFLSWFPNIINVQ